MKIDTRFINSKIGRRIFFMFGLCALLPIVFLAVSSYFQVSRQLEQQCYRRLQKEVKGHGLSIYERLLFLETELMLIGGSIENGSQGSSKPASSGQDGGSRRFKLVSMLNDELKSRGDGDEGIKFEEQFTIREKEHLNGGQTILKVESTSNARSHIFMIRQLSHSSEPAKYLVGEIEQHYLWGTVGGTSVSALTDIFVFDEANHLLYSSNAAQQTIPMQLRDQMARTIFGQFDLDFDGERYLGAFRLIFMQPKFLVKGWRVVLRQPASYVLQPMTTFRKTFPIVVLISFFVILLLSIFYIRKSLVPLDLLKAGMLSVGGRGFHHRIDLDSNDEFQELALHFNQMSGQLDQHFKTLNTMAEIDRSILSSLETKTIIETAIIGMQGLFDSDLIAINVFDKLNLNAQRYFFLKTSPAVQKDMVTFHEKDVDMLSKQQVPLVFDSSDHPPGFLKIYENLGLKQYLVSPVLIEQRLAAVVVLATNNKLPYNDVEVVQSRQMADQVGVALANANLLKELNLVSWGTLRAFARAVDAKSPWTAGHSERVARISVMVGHRMGLDTKTMEHLRRAGFLHDIGKIGVSTSILDKPGKLTTEEFDMIKTHPDLGARIIEPIQVFAPMIPMIRQHHEKYAGGGYPDGVSAEHIDPCARIMSVADVYDALVSDRPYRKGMSLDKTLSIMIDESGKAFDPEILEIFLEVLKSNNNLAALKPGVSVSIQAEVPQGAVNNAGPVTAKQS